MRLVLVGVAGVLSLALAACGGDSSNPTPTPTPTPTGTPTPTPTPTAVAYTTSETALQYTTVGGVQRVANTQFVAPAMGSVFAFTPAQNGYTYTLLNGTVAPSASETAIFTAASTKVCDVTTLCFGNAFYFQQVPAGAGSYYLSRIITGTANPLMALSYTAFGTFEEALPGATATAPPLNVDLRPFAYGVSSPAGAIPTTGTVTFNGLVVGQATGNKPGATGTSNIYKLTGTSQLVINYVAGTATLKLVLVGEATGCTTCSPDLKVTYDSTAGTLAGGVLTFTLPGGGTAKFFLAGGAAAVAATSTTAAVAAVPPLEVAGSFTLTAADPNDAGVTMVVAGAGGGLR